MNVLRSSVVVVIGVVVIVSFTAILDTPAEAVTSVENFGPRIAVA
jgi:preprotein translocase subunit SecE